MGERHQRGPDGGRPNRRLPGRGFLAQAGVGRVPLAVLLLVAACSGTPGATPGGSGGGSGAQDGGSVRVVTTTTVLADLVRQVGGSRARVESLAPLGGVVETYEPSPSDIARVASAALVVANGLGIDAWFDRIAADTTAGRVPVVRLAENLPGATYLRGDQPVAGQAATGSGGEVNPHLWMNVTYARGYVQRIADALSSVDPAGAATYRSGAAAYDARLATLDAWVRERITTIPPANRKLVSLHEAFPYYAAAYGLQVVGSVLSAPGQDPSAGQVAALVDAIRSSGARAVFTEAQFSPKLAEQIAAEAGVSVVSNLYNDTLGPPPVDSYEGLIRWDTERVVEALR